MTTSDCRPSPVGTNKDKLHIEAKSMSDPVSIQCTCSLQITYSEQGELYIVPVGVHDGDLVLLGCMTGK